MARIAVITTVRDRIAHLAEMRRGLAWQRLVRAPGDVEHVIVRMGGADPWLDLPEGPPVVPVEMVLAPGADRNRLPLAAARNAGAAATSADLLIFLDVDCIPCPELVERYRWFAQQSGGLSAGPVGYLPEALSGRPLDPEELARLAVPHPARPVPTDGALIRERRYELFWSLSFAIRRSDYVALGGFCEDYVGYGGEDTDLALTAQQLGMPFSWVGGAWAWHQYHPIEDPPRRHLTDIVANAQVYRRRWGRWPMEGWLRAFADEGLIEWDSSGDTLRLLSAAITSS
ncbi:MAG: galactosyltransferase-related protein [Actinomycetota bacterium]|nr:galactosyltransferase-related protein [Actinomycetota bacterium]